MSAATASTSPPRTPTGRQVVVHVLNILDRGGLEVRTLELVRSLDPDTLRTIICTLSGRRGELAAAYEEAGAEVVPLPLLSLAFPYRFWRLLRATGADAVHSHIHFSSGAILAVAAAARVPVRIAHFRSDSHGHAGPGLLRRLYYAGARALILLLATDVVGVSPSSLSANWGTRARRDPRFQVLPNGVGVPALHPDRGRALRAELGVSADVPLILHVGRAEIASKNRPLAVAVLRGVHERGLPAVLAFVGRHGSDPASRLRHEQLLESIASAGLDRHVLILGERGDVPDLLAAADVLVSTSTLEGLPGAVLEAAACGLPVVSSDVPGAVFISQHVAGVRIVALDSALDAWSDAICDAVAGSRDLDRRSHRREQFASSPFGLDGSVAAHRALWGHG